MFPRYDVFLSYSRADSDRVVPLRDELRRIGYRVFFDVQSIDPASPWKLRLRQAIRSSRLLVLCWSEHARGSDYIDFEYMQADALHKPICPWLLDKTPLPPMLEAQAVANPSAVEVVARLKPILGWPLGRRRKAWQATAVVAVALLSVVAWHISHPSPPPPWEFQGEVTDRVSGMPIAGVEVDVMNGNDIQTSALTDARGRFDLHLPRPIPQAVDLRYRKEGYEGDRKFVSADTPQPFPEDMVKP
jgi:TIR domain/Carboxypeptidase regulatory-like domain